jgi:hypothetical protein
MYEWNLNQFQNIFAMPLNYVDVVILGSNAARTCYERTTAHMRLSLHETH